MIELRPAFVLSALAAAQAPPTSPESPYAGEQGRDVKALSADACAPIRVAKRV